METAIIRDARIIISCKAWQLFAQECEIPYPGNFWKKWINIFTPTQRHAKLLWLNKRNKLAQACSHWEQELVRIFWSNEKPLCIRPNFSKRLSVLGDDLMSHGPLIATPSIEVGQLTITPQVLSKVVWMMENPTAKAVLIRVHDEAQKVMSQATASLVVGASLKEAVQRKRSEYWHPYDLVQSRIRTSELVQDLRQGSKQPEDTKHDLLWRGVSKDRTNWRNFNYTYEIFIDELGVAYQFGVNNGVEPIDHPSDLVEV